MEHPGHIRMENRCQIHADWYGAGYDPLPPPPRLCCDDSTKPDVVCANEVNPLPQQRPKTSRRLSQNGIHSRLPQRWHIITTSCRQGKSGTVFAIEIRKRTATAHGAIFCLSQPLPLLRRRRTTLRRPSEQGKRFAAATAKTLRHLGRLQNHVTATL